MRRLRPAPLDYLDLVGGDFTDGLWVAEGFTRYYEFLACTRTGIYSPEQFFSTVVNYYRHLEVLPAYHRVSAVDSSRATYLNHRKYPGRVNNAIDYYDKGMLIAFGADTALRVEKSGTTLDEAFAAFYAHFVGRGAGYTSAEVRDYFDEVFHPGVGSRMYREATDVAGLDVAGHLRGLAFVWRMRPSAISGWCLPTTPAPLSTGCWTPARPAPAVSPRTT